MCREGSGLGKAVSALKSQEEALKRARRFAEKASKILDVVAVYIVGSRARGEYLEDSDIDVVVVARNVRILNALERIKLLENAAEPNVDYRIYDIWEWEGEVTTWIKQLRKEAIKIYP